MLIQEWRWDIIGACISALVLLVAVGANIVKPRYRRWRLKRPVKAYFHIRAINEGTPLPYVFQNEQAHNVKQLVVPANADVEIEVAYNPLIDFRLAEACFAIDGAAGIKPSIEKRSAPFIAKTVNPEAKVTATDYWDRQGNYHFMPRSSGRSVGSCYTTGFILRTREPGTYKAWIGFLTDEIDGVAGDLSIIVAERPTMRMKCVEHWQCHVKPTHPK